MATVTNTIKLPDGSTPSHAAAVIELVASTTGKAAGWVTATDVTILSKVRPTVTNGTWSADLTPNANITPSGTVYKVTETADRVQYVHYITVTGAGSLFDMLTDAPDAVASSALEAGLAARQRKFAIDVRDYGATGDGTTDDATDINEAMAAAAAGSTKMVVVPPGTYIIGSSIAAGDDVTLYLARGATIKAKAATNVNMILIDGIDRFTLCGPGTIDGNLSNQTGTVTDSGQADGIRIVGDSTFITLRDFTIKNVKGWTMAVDSATDVLIDGITMSGGQEKGINTNTADTSRVRITNSYLSTAGGGTFPSSAPIEIDDGASHIVVTNNVIDAAPSLGVTVHGHSATAHPHDIEIVGNVIRNSGDHAIRVAAHRDGSDNLRRVLVADNMIDGTTNGAGVAVVSNGGSGTATAEDVLILGNSVYNTNDEGITLALATRAQVVGNIVKYAGDHGIFVNGGASTNLVQYAKIENNHVIDPGTARASADRDGIAINNSSIAVTIRGNHVEETRSGGSRRMRYAVNTRDSGITGTRVERNVMINPVTKKVNNGTTDTVWGDPYLVAQSAVPFVSVSSGSMGNNGALSGITALPRTYAQCYLYMPANAISSGSAAGWYYAVMSSTTAGTVYNNTYTSGVPVPPSSPTAFSTTGPGAFTGDTSERTIALTIPGGSMGPNGQLEIVTLWTFTNNGNTKTPRVRFGGTSGTLYESLTVTNLATCQNIAIIRNVNSESAQVGGYSGTVPFSTSTNSPVTSTVDTSSDTTVVLSNQKATATDNFALEAFSIMVKPAW